MNLTKKVEDLYIENYKIMLRIIRNNKIKGDTNKQNTLCFHGSEQLILWIVFSALFPESPGGLCPWRQRLGFSILPLFPWQLQSQVQLDLLQRWLLRAGSGTTCKWESYWLQLASKNIPQKMVRSRAINYSPFSLKDVLRFRASIGSPKIGQMTSHRVGFLIFHTQWQDHKFLLYPLLPLWKSKISYTIRKNCEENFNSSNIGYKFWIMVRKFRVRNEVK